MSRSAASSNRISQGRSKLNENLSILTSAESIYGTPKEITAAIWGMESSYGAGMGSMDLVSALSSLAYDGRRREFAENQLLAMLLMIERGDVAASQLKRLMGRRHGTYSIYPNDMDTREYRW